MSNQCTKCGGRADAFLCRECSTELRANLTQIPWIASQLAVAHVKQAQLDEAAPPQRAVTSEDEEQSPVPFNANARRRYDELRTLCMRWVRDICDQLSVEFWPVNAVPHDFIGPLRPLIPARNLERAAGYPGQWRMPVSGYVPSVTDLSRWLLANHLNIVNSEDAAMCAMEFDNTIRAAYREINRRKRIYCGPCPAVLTDPKREPRLCAEPIYAEWDDRENRPETFTACPRCRTSHDTLTLRQRAFAQAEHFLMTTSEILAVLEDLGEPLSINTFKQWRKRGKLKPRGYMHSGRVVNNQVHKNDPPVFQFGEVRTLQRRAPAIEEDAHAV